MTEIINKRDSSTLVKTVCSEQDARSSVSLNSSFEGSQNSAKFHILPSSTKDSIFCEKMSFKIENEWSESSDCKVCSQLFNKLKGVFKHHCRVCGCSCCGECSSKKVNDKRVCDICYLRVENTELIEKKKGILALKDQLMEEMFNELNGLAIKNQEIDAQMQEMQQIVKQDQRNYVDKMGSLREELKQCGDAYKQKLEDYKGVRELIKKDRDVLVEKEKLLAENNKKCLIWKDEVLHKEHNYKSKAMELADYMKIFGKIKDCESFHHLKISMDDLEILRTNSKEHSSFIISAQKKKMYGLSNLSKFSSHKDLRGNSQQSEGSGLFLFSKKPSAKDLKDSIHSSMIVKQSMAMNVKEGSIYGDQDTTETGGCCHNNKCRIF